MTKIYYDESMGKFVNYSFKRYVKIALLGFYEENVESCLENVRLLQMFAVRFEEMPSKNMFLVRNSAL